MENRKKRKEITIWAIIFWGIVWHIGSLAINSSMILVSPTKVAETLVLLIVSPQFWEITIFSFIRISGGFFLGILMGCILAAVSERFIFIKQLICPIVFAVKSVPVASFIILALLWFSSENLSVFISFLMVFPIIYTNVCKGIEETDIKLLEMADVFEITGIKRIGYIYIPEILPFFRAGCSLAIGLCWKSGIAAEVIGIPKGSIGEQLQQSKVYLETSELFAWTVVIVIVSLLFEKVFLWLIDTVATIWERM